MTPEQRYARYEHLHRLLVKPVQDDRPDDAADERTEADWAEAQRYQAERNQQQDDAWRNGGAAQYI